ncbi:MAG: ABC transporter ATP-binding protein [Clostridia bacterium]|nr:ABC transporter ATP-binding protein [Clostridia bacterium]
MAKVINEQKKHTPAPRAQVFTDEEVIGLEQSFIDSYLSSDTRPIHILFRIYRRFWRELLISMFFYFLKTSPVLALPIVTSNIINVVAYETGDMVVPHLLMNIGVMVLLLLLNIPTHMLYVRYHSMVVRRVEAGLRGAMVRKLQQLSITFHKEMQSGRIQSKLMRDVETVQSLSDQIFSNIPGVLINMITALTVVITTQPTMFVFFMLCIPTAVATVRLFRNGISRRNSEYRQNMETASAGLMDMVEMTQITRAHALENREIKKMTARLNEVANTGFRLDMVQALFGSCSWVVFNIFQLVCLVFSSYMAWQGAIQVGDISLYQSYFSSLTGQVSALIGMLPIITKGLESVRSIGEILGNTDIEDNTGKAKMTSLRGEYEFRGVHFHYEDDQPLLRGLDLHVREGETIAIVGESGSGKSTILNLVIGFNLAQEGQVLIDGQDIKEIDLHSYRKHIAIVPQNSVLFTGTIRENITYGIKNVTDELIARALEAARLTSFISTLPRGVDTMLEEHGANLSGGQRQRLSIARAIIRDPDVIILDEATSALDSISEKEIQHAINNLTKNRTTFIVAHRLSTIRDADRIAVIKGGVCVEIGSYEELMAARGEFYHMQTAQ